MGTTDTERAADGTGGRGRKEAPDGTFTVAPAARSERLARRVVGLERQLAVRIDNEEDLLRLVAQVQREAADQIAGMHGEIRRFQEVARARESALAAELASSQAQLVAARAEFAALLNTKTLRLARRPRRLYADLRSNPSARALLSKVHL